MVIKFLNGKNKNRTIVYGIKDKPHEVITEMTSIYGRMLAHKKVGDVISTSKPQISKQFEEIIKFYATPISKLNGKYQIKINKIFYINEMLDIHKGLFLMLKKQKLFFSKK